MSEFNAEAVENAARVMNDKRLESVRSLVDARQRLTDAQTADQAAYAAARKAGWTPEQLAELGISEPTKPARARSRRSRRGTGEAPAVTADN
ncbi:hypothetical protein ATK17_3936 [Branchiibius hedensis]|uniref:Uncharacterized protein n=1 Tax=Branchiibius hedensis TaxID=672460 RepID=A0A2Y9BPJ4_9MICO|nr:hypothetical protein [Branchiibius hedensis]PWJ22994.1 hypothetical protein ATK17_3884 [Branchiibius hedensis]PWJ23045.1 hypothetical protein ATK17_3936 [Branchiibius hedensis]SSA59070.1 hypothetical protein SAMN04489750_3884 [Branchiibius hedensis]SSA59121.1 hypothetical protein SAMN04489750_3936 [Branchiibius hedensis]